jgi:hypothetical protein
MNLFQMIDMLSVSKVDYVVVGGLAVALHGYQRVTMDVDVVLAMTPENLQSFIDAAKAAGLRPVAPVPIDSMTDSELLERWFQDKGMLAFGLRGPETTSTVIDVLIKPPIAFAELRRDAVIVEVGTLKVPIASIDHLIAMKTGTGRSKDILDIEELRKLQENRSK